MLNCSGKSLPKFVKKSEFNIQRVVKDSVFLEGIQRALRNSTTKSDVLGQNRQTRKVGKKMSRILESSKTRIKFLDPESSRSNLNQTHVENNQIFWTLEFYYKKSFIVHNCSQENDIYQVWSTVLEKIESDTVFDYKRFNFIPIIGAESNNGEASTVNTLLDSNTTATSYKYEIKFENNPVHGTLAQVLGNKQVLEFPTFVVNEIL